MYVAWLAVLAVYVRRDAVGGLGVVARVSDARMMILLTIFSVELLVNCVHVFLLVFWFWCQLFLYSLQAL